LRKEFSSKIKLQAFENAAGHCTRCSARLYPAKFRYNHRIPDAQGGDNSLANCEVLCLACDREQTYKHDLPAIAKTNRIRKRAAGIRKPRRITRWRRFDGTIVKATKER
jgi:5-methylcytosine-specific restriction protein A